MRAAGLVVLVAVALAGCGGGDDGRVTSADPSRDERVRGERPESEFEEVVLDLRDAAEAGEVYDAYGFAEYMPAAQRAAIDAFCFVVERTLQQAEAGELRRPGGMGKRIVARASVEFDYGDPARIGAEEMAAAKRAIRKLRTIIDVESIEDDLASRYVTACYNRR